MGFLVSKQKQDTANPANPKKNKTFQLQMLKEHEGGINAMALNEDATAIATGSDDKTIRIWSAHTECSECIGLLVGHEGYVNCVIFDDVYIISGSSDKTIRKWDMSTFECLVIYTGHKSVINRLICTGEYIFSSSYDRTARCWENETGTCIRVFEGHKMGVYPMAFVTALDESKIIHSDDGNMEVVDGANGDLLITGSTDTMAIAWSFETGKPVHTYAGHTGGVTCLALFDKDAAMVTGSMDKTIRSWNVRKGELFRIFEGHTNAVICLTVENI